MRERIKMSLAVLGNVRIQVVARQSVKLTCLLFSPIIKGCSHVKGYSAVRD